MLKRLPILFPSVAVAAVIAGVWPGAALAATSPRLGTALNFTVLAGSTITNTGPSVITGNLGLHAGSAVTGFPPGVVTGVKHVHDAVALRAKNDLKTAYTDAANAPTTSDLTGKNLGGKNLVPGVYKFSSSAQLTGALTLSGKGVFIFKIGSTLTTASNADVRLTNGAQACGVYWQVGSSATLGTSTHFQGNLMALTSITLNTHANILTGRALARNGALTLDSNRITPPAGACTLGSSSGGGSGGSGSTPVPGTGVGDGFALPALLIVAGGAIVEVGRRTRGTRRATSAAPRAH